MLAFMRDEKKHFICLVGGGGKTTIMYELAHFYASHGKKVLVLTSTHIMQPADCYAEDAAAVQALWDERRYAVIGTPEAGSGKLTMPSAELYARLCRQADIILCEADGAKHLPCKLPAAHEPVILPECDIVLAVCGADAMGKRLQEVCFRWQLGAEWLAGKFLTAAELSSLELDAKLLARLMTDERGACKNVRTREYYVVLNKCDTISKVQAQEMYCALLQRGVPQDHIWLRGELQGKSFHEVF